MEDLADIANAALLRGLTAEQRNVLAALGRTVELAPSEYLCRLGDEARDVFIVCSGTIELVLPMDAARQQHPVIVEEISTGETVGWSALTAPNRYTLDARAARPTVLLAIDRDELGALCDAKPALGRDLMRNLVATMGHRLRMLHAMWVRELRRNMELEHAPAE
jgi:CRP-like cAMP-binding protein